MSVSYKYLFRVMITGIFCLQFVLAANAQRPTRGGSRGSGSSDSRHYPAPSRANPRSSHPVNPGRVIPRSGYPNRYSPSYRYGYRAPYTRYYYPRYRYYYPYHGYRHFYAPRIGIHLGILPAGWVSFYYGPNLFYYYDGFFYRNYNIQYEVVAPPIGGEVPALPSGAREIRINGEVFYENNGVYFKRIVRPDGSVAYVVAGKDGELNTGNESQMAIPQIGDVVSELPPDCREVTINRDLFYVSPDGVYYQESTDENNNRIYTVVGGPSAGEDDRQ